MESFCKQFNTIEIGLKIHILSLSLPKDLIKETEEIRMSVTSQPDRRKHYFYYTAKQFLSQDLVCSLNITNEAKEIKIIIRRKNFLEGHPIIGTVNIESDKLPKIPQNINQLSIEKKSTDINTFKIIKHFKMPNSKFNPNINVAGDMKIQMFVIPPNPDFKHSNSKDNNVINPIKNIKNINDALKEPIHNSYDEYILF